MLKVILFGWAIVTLIGVELRGSEVYSEGNSGSWIKVHAVNSDTCRASGGVFEEDMDFNTSVCNIQDYNLEKLIEG